MKTQYIVLDTGNLIKEIRQLTVVAFIWMVKLENTLASLAELYRLMENGCQKCPSDGSKGLYGHNK
jgi:hypothetical protein